MRRHRRQRLLQQGLETLESRAMLAVTFSFNYVKNEPGVGFDHPDTALVAIRKAALEDAAATFGSWFTQSASLKIDVEDFHDGPLDSNGFPIIRVANTDPGFVRTVPEAKIQTGVDPNGEASDGVLLLNWEDGNPDVQAVSPRWNFTDTIGVNDMDFKGEVIHSLAHILGFQSQITQAGEDVFRDPLVHLPGDPGTWVTFDKFVSTASGTPLINAADFKLDILEWSTSSTAGSQPESGLFFNGEHAKAANGGNPVPLYSPTVFVPNGTASHLRPSATVNRSNTLMIAAEPGTQNVGPQARRFTPVEIGIMRDLGYALDTTAPKPILSTTRPSPTNSNSPFTVTADFGEAILATFDLNDIEVTNGTASELSGAGSVFTFTVTPAPAITQGTVSILIPANATSDLAGNASLASDPLNIVIDAPVTPRPMANDDAFQIIEDSGISLLSVLDNDIVRAGANGILLSIDSVSGGTTPVIPATQGTVNQVGNRIDFAPADNFFGNVSFTYRMDDDSGQAPENGSRQVATVTVIVSEVNDAPVAEAIDRGNIFATVRNEFDLTETLSNMSRGAANESGQTLKIVSVGLSTLGVQPQISPDGFKIFYTAPLGASGTDSFSYTVEDNGTTSGVADFKRSTASVNLSISPFIPSSARGSVYVDNDRNDRRDIGDLGMGGVDVFLHDGTVQLAHEVTDAQGRYSFESLPPGTFTVSFVVPSFIVDSAQANFLTRTIVAPGGINVQHDFAVLGLTPGYRNVLENLASSYYLQDNELRSAGLVAVMGADGKSEWTSVRGGGFETDSFHEVVLSDDRRNAYITAVRGATNEVFTATLTNRRNFVVIQDPEGRILIRVIARSADLTWTKINTAAPPVLPARKFFAAVDEFLGSGNVVLNPSSTIAPIILVSKDGQPAASLSVTASGGTNTFDVALNAAPVNGVVVLNVQAESTTHVQVTNPAGPANTLTFTAANWHVPQTVTVQGKNDGTPAVQNHTTKINIAVNEVTTAANFTATLPQSVDVETIDNASATTVVVTGGGKYALAPDAESPVFTSTDLPTTVGNANFGVPVAMGDVNGDSIPDIVLGSAGGPGQGSLVTLINGATQQVLRTFAPFPGLTGSIFVAVGDINGDGRDEVITGAGPGAPPLVKWFDARSGAELGAFFASTGSITSSGVTVAAGDVDGDGSDEIITGDASGVQVSVHKPSTQQDLASVAAFSSTEVNGINVAAGDLDGDGKAEIVAATRAGAAPEVRVFNGQSAQLLRAFFAFPPEETGGASVAVDARSHRLYASTMTGPSQLRGFNGQTLAIEVEANPFPTLNGANIPRYIAVADTSVAEKPPAPEIRLLPGTSLNRDESGNLVTNASSLSLIVDFGTKVTGFGEDDLQINGGRVTSFAEANGLFRFQIVPSTGPNAEVTINIAEGAAQSLLGLDASALPEPFKLLFDHQPPISIFRVLGSTTNSEAETIFIERNPETTTFDPQKLTATNGVITNLSPQLGEGLKFTITPITRGQPTTITAAAGFLTDLAGNKSPESSKSITFAAATAPALIPKLTSFESTSTTLASVPFTVDFGTPVNGITASTPEITNGSVVGEVQHDGNGVYAFIVRPQSAGELKVRIPAGRVSDAANATRLNVESNTITLLFSATAPKPEIVPSAAAGNLANGGSSTLSAVPFQVLFNAPVDGFRAEEIQIIGGTVANFAGEDSQPIYTFEVIPDGSGQISLSIPAGVAKDVDQTDNLPSAPFNFQSNAAGDVAVSVVSDPSTARAGADIFYLVRVRNQGRGTVSSVNVAATLPAEMTFVPITDVLADARVSATGQNVSINVGDLPAFSEQFFTVQIRLSQNAAVNSTPSITFNVTGTNDGNLDNNAATIAKTVIPGVTEPMTSATIKDATNGGDVTVSVPADSGASISSLVSTPVLAVPALVEAAALPVGVDVSATSFNVNLAQGGAVVVTLRPPGGVPTNSTFVKYGKLPGGTEPTLYPFLFDGTVGAKLFPDRIEIHLKDGAKGDNDGIVNGVIVDPGFVTSLNPIFPFQSTTNPFDVDGSGSVLPIDALLIINELNKSGSFVFPSFVPMPVSSFLFLDTSGDGSLTPLDALVVINALNRAASGGGEPELEEEIVEPTPVTPPLISNQAWASDSTSMDEDEEERQHMLARDDFFSGLG